MWTSHPDNDSREAWNDLMAELEHLLPIAESVGVALGVEPEIANTVNSPCKARRLLDDLKSSRLKIIMDGANIFGSGDLARMHSVLDAAFDLLAGDIALAHAKDLDRDGEAGHLPPGKGLLDYGYYLSLLATSGFDGAIILHALQGEAEAADRLAFVQQKAPSDYVRPRPVGAIFPG
jgi:sugar phosphate isomerase/epimerase